MKKKYLYIGRRHGDNGKVYRCFLCDGKEVFFSRVRHCYIGQTYWGKAESMPVRPERVMGDEALHVSEKDLELYEARDMATQVFIDERNSKRKAEKLARDLSRTKRIKFLKKEISEITKGMDYFERQLFLRAVCK